MYKNFRSTGFTLVEALVTLAVTAVVVAGVSVTFSNVSRAAISSQVNADLTNSTRGLADFIGSDFANAGRGFSDLSAFDIHFKLSPEFASKPPEEPEEGAEEPFMYALADLETVDDSSITLQWFDYDANENFSYLYEASDNDISNGGTLFTNNEDALLDIEPGDIFLIYNVKPTRLTHSGQTAWTAFDDVNDALVVQVGETSQMEFDSALTAHQGMGGKIEVTFADGNVFSKNVDEPVMLATDPSVETNFSEEFTDEDSPARKRGYTLNEGYWIARKLGDRNSYQRVRYEVLEGAGADGVTTRVLSRWHNGRAEIVATGVETFKIKLGLDVTPDLIDDLETLDVNLMDGLVSGLDGAAWVDGATDSDPGDGGIWGPLDNREIRMAMGRHGLQAELTFTQKSLVDDRRRGFTQQYRLRNVSAPLPMGD